MPNRMAYFVEVIIFFWSDYSTHKRETFQVFAFAKSHGRDVHLAVIQLAASTSLTIELRNSR